MRPATLSLLLAGILPSVAATAAPLPDFEASYKLEQHNLRIGKETLDLPAGTFKTVKVAKLRKGIDQETIIWFAPALHYLPVRIWQRDSDDEEYQSDLEEFSHSLRGKKNKR